MGISTKSKWYYGHEITKENYTIDFNEGAGALKAVLNVGIYSLTDFVTEVKRALDDAGNLTYTVSVNRDTRLITISAGSNFSLLTTSGASIGTSAFSLIGFSGADKTGANSYVGGSASGYEYKPQLELQKYVPFENNVKSSLATVNESASGVVEVVSFGSIRYMECEVKWVTDQTIQSGAFIENDASAVANLRNFLAFAVKKGDMEFMPDRDTTSTFYKCILESTQASSNGVDYRITETAQLQNWYESGKLVFREVN